MTCMKCFVPKPVTLIFETTVFLWLISTLPLSTATVAAHLSSPLHPVYSPQLPSWTFQPMCVMSRVVGIPHQLSLGKHIVKPVECHTVRLGVGATRALIHCSGHPNRNSFSKAQHILSILHNIHVLGYSLTETEYLYPPQKVCPCVYSGFYS